jgi:hypothetical protein
MKIVTLIGFLFFGSIAAHASYWQQRADYQMEIDMDEQNNTFTGKQTLTYRNNSPYTLDKVYYHLYFNAFRPNSEMDVRSRSLPDPDKRVGSRIFFLDESETGYQQIHLLKQDGVPLTYEVQGTIPGAASSFYMEFSAQVPLQIRRSGRDNAEGIRFSMTQWYPKICEFDRSGWHTDPYIGREFHGVWGNFSVKISIDSSYLIGATGVLQNPEEIGKGYEEKGRKIRRKNSSRLTWHFIAENVHDFMWAADPDYVHYYVDGPNATRLHVIYQPDSITSAVWPELGSYMSRAMEIMNTHFGDYPYPQYSFIQGGDGGMEYPMGTLVTGHRNLGSLVGVSVHELNHSWFQGLLAFDESRYYWMDEGFTEFSGEIVMSRLFPSVRRSHRGAYDGYLRIAGTPDEQPLTTHADWYSTNRAYGIAAYNKGNVFLHQLKYMLGDSVFYRSMRQFFEQWKFRHPVADDLKIIMELNSGTVLSWYFDQWIQTTHTIDYSVRQAVLRGNRLTAVLGRNGEIPMPLEVALVYEDGSSEWIHIPFDLMLSRKSPRRQESFSLMPWRWVDKEYTFELEVKPGLKKIIIDPEGWLADTDTGNNSILFTDK